LVDILDAPMPFIVGITNEVWCHHQPDREYLDDKCIIYINKDNTLTVQATIFSEAPAMDFLFDGTRAAELQ